MQRVRALGKHKLGSSSLRVHSTTLLTLGLDRPVKMFLHNLRTLWINANQDASAIPFAQTFLRPALEAVHIGF
jgi:hypothetical protein